MIKNNKICLFTNDVETTSIVNNCLSDKMGERVFKEGMPKLLELYNKNNVKSTFFFTVYIAQKFPDIVKMILPYGHEVGCHGYSHRDDDALDVLGYNEQLKIIKKAKTILEDISGTEVVSFRAPALRINFSTQCALEDSGFFIDSSTSSQRMDMFFSYGSRNKLYWILQPRIPFRTMRGNIWKRGNSNLFEIPISSFVLPYIGTFMRISPGITSMLRHILCFENALNRKPIEFLIHPNEVILEKNYINENLPINKRTNNRVTHFIKDILRQKLKNRNLGDIAITLLANEIKYFHYKDFTFMTLKDYYNIFN